MRWRRASPELTAGKPMTSAQGIAKLGFRRWYERQLIEGHVYFVTCFLSLIVIAAGLEMIDWQAPVLQFLYMLGVIAGSGALCVTSLRRYNFLLGRAECLGAQSCCQHCQTYGILLVVGSGARNARGGVFDAADDTWIRVRCKKCGHEWRMDNT
jgi:hypothetical protein